jgi:hypothetical protein
MDLEQTILVHKKVREWLMSEWDPIGVSEYPEAFGEYRAYEREIADLLIAGATTEELAKHLFRQEQEHMGLPDDPQGASRGCRTAQEAV